MSWKGFGELDLSDVKGESGSARLREGSYRVKCTDAEIVAPGKEGSKDRAVLVTLVCQDGHGDIKVNFNVFHNNEQAQDIGLRQFKGFLEVSGHPNPDRPGDVKSLIGLSCAVIVGMGKPWTDKDGKQRQNTEVKKFMTKDAPVTGPSPVSAAAAPAAKGGSTGGGTTRRDLDDEIPF